MVSVVNSIKMLLMVFLVVSNFASASLFDSMKDNGPVSVDEAFVFNLEELGENKVLLRWDIRDGYYLYDNKMSFSVSGDAKVTDISRSPTKSKDDPLFGKVDVYYYTSEIVLQLTGVTRDAVLALHVGYQGCWDGGVCYPPESVVHEIQVEATAIASADTQVKSSNIQTQSNAGTNTTATLTNDNAEHKDTTSTAQYQGVSEQDYFSGLLSQGNLLWIVGAFFVAGLALSFTPCVFPMIPIISSIIAGQGKNVSRTKAFYLSAIYVLSVAFTYTLAGIFAGLFGENLQILFQTPWIIALFSGVFVLLALSMFGFYELQLPNALQSKLSAWSNNQEGGSYVGVSVMGVLSALIVGPCMAAPLAGALIYIGQSADPVIGGVALFSLSIGMGVPLMLVGVSAGHLMPRVGAWMNAVKASFGVLLLLMAIYMLDRIVSLQITMLLVAITLIISAVYMGALNTEKSVDNLRTFFKGVGLIVFFYGLSLFVGVLIGNGNFFKPLKGLTANGQAVALEQSRFVKVTTPAQLAPILATAKRDQQPVMLDFYADWCISCVEVELMFEQPDVALALQKMTLVKVDLTDFNEESRELLKTYNVIGPPALVFYNREGELAENMTIIGVTSAEQFMQHIQPL